MITTKKLKICTLVTHGLIIVGAGHGILFFFIIEVLAFPYITKNNFSFSFNTIDNHFPVIGLLSLLGQVTFILSIFLQEQLFKNLFQTVGLILLWFSVIYFTYDTTKDSYTHLAWVTVVPFATCTIITFLAQPIKRFYDRVLDK